MKNYVYAHESHYMGNPQQPMQPRGRILRDVTTQSDRHQIPTPMQRSLPYTTLSISGAIHKGHILVTVTALLHYVFTSYFVISSYICYRH